MKSTHNGFIKNFLYIKTDRKYLLRKVKYI